MWQNIITCQTDKNIVLSEWTLLIAYNIYIFCVYWLERVRACFSIVVSQLNQCPTKSHVISKYGRQRYQAAIVNEEEIIKPSKRHAKQAYLKVYSIILTFRCCTQPPQRCCAHQYMLRPCNIGYSFSEDVACSNETLELYYKLLNMPILHVFCWALFLLRLSHVTLPLCPNYSLSLCST